MHNCIRAWGEWAVGDLASRQDRTREQRRQHCGKCRFLSHLMSGQARGVLDWGACLMGHWRKNRATPWNYLLGHRKIKRI